jgi:hypothetical protein
MRYTPSLRGIPVAPSNDPGVRSTLSLGNVGSAIPIPLLANPVGPITISLCAIGEGLKWVKV